jgi:undecaprenyl-diphosphatase
LRESRKLPNPEELAAVRALDTAVIRALDRVRSPALDRVMYTISSAADHSLLWFAIGGLRAWRRNDARFALRFAITIGLESAITNGAIKSLFRRVRPEHEIDTGPLPYGMRRPITSSFPSGHATAAFTAATVLAHTGRGDALWYGAAAVVASSRVYVKMHHASDVLVGAALGVVMGKIANRLLFPTR